MWQAQIPDSVHHELLNWARWCWSGAWPHPLPPTECGSLEAGYRAPPMWGEDHERRVPVIRPNEPRARIVQEAWEKLPKDEKAVIKEEYPASMQPRLVQGHEAAARRLAMRLETYEHLLGQAVKRIEGAVNVVRA